MFFDSQLGWRWYAILAVVVVVSFGLGCWQSLHLVSNFIDNHIALGIPIDYTVKSLPHYELIMVSDVVFTGIVVMLLSDLFRPFTGHYQPNWLGKRN